MDIRLKVESVNTIKPLQTVSDEEAENDFFCLGKAADERSSISSVSTASTISTACDTIQTAEPFPKTIDQDPGRAAKRITFIRHGKSAGNAGLSGTIEKGHLGAYKDCELVKQGRCEAIARAARMEVELARHIVNADLVIVSPLRRAMETALLVLGECRKTVARHDQLADIESVPMPAKLEVWASVREKVKSDSERPGMGRGGPGDIPRYLAETARSFGKGMTKMAAAMAASYEFESTRTKGWTSEPRDANAYIKMIDSFRHDLSERSEMNVVIFGHSGWARHAFPLLFPAAREKALIWNLINGVRKIQPLKNVGIVQAVLQDSSFKACSSHDPLSNHEEDEEKFGILTSPLEAQEAGMIPADGWFERVPVWKGGKKKLVVFSASQGSVYLTYGNKWGEPSNKIYRIQRSTSITRSGNSFSIYVREGGSKAGPLKLTTEDSDADAFYGLFLHYQALSSQSRQYTSV